MVCDTLTLSFILLSPGFPLYYITTEVVRPTGPHHHHHQSNTACLWLLTAVGAQTGNRKTWLDQQHSYYRAGKNKERKPAQLPANSH